MVDKLTDIEKWKTNYPFLMDLWNSYDKFDNNVKDNTNKKYYETVCLMFLNPFSHEKMEQYNFCMKLLRNLGVFLEEGYPLNFTRDSCNNLNYWIYNSIKKDDIKDDLILKCFEEYFDRTKRVPGTVECKYHSYDESYDDPMVAIMLNIFDSNIMDIQKTLLSAALPTYTRGEKFVCECFKIYKERYNTQCLNKHPVDEKQKNTCDKLGTFRRTYELFLLIVESIAKKIPLFDDIEREYKAKCKRHEQIQVVVPHVEDTGDGLSTDYVGERINGSPSLTADAYGKLSLGHNGQETTGSPVSSTISTAVGTMAGASSVLALLYKFTPGRKWIHSGFGGRRARIGSNLYEEGASELLYNGPESEDFSSYNQRYDIGYSPV